MNRLSDREKKRGGGEGGKGRETCNGLSVTSSLIGSTCLKLPTSNYRRTRDTRRTVPFIVLKSTHNGINSLSLIAVSRHPSPPPPPPFGEPPRFACIHTFAGYYGTGICISLCREKRIIAGTWIKTVRIRSFQGSTREPGTIVPIETIY